MLSPTEKVLFILLVAVSLMATYNTFGNMFKIILRGQGQLRFDHFVRRAWQGYQDFKRRVMRKESVTA